MSELRLIDGPLADTRSAKTALLERMARDLIAYDAAHNEQDAIRCLMARGYSPFEVLRLVPDARALAFQEIVAREMGEP